MVLSKQQKELLDSIFRLFPKDKVKLLMTKNGEIIFPTEKTEISFVTKVVKGLSPMSEKSFMDGKWYQCTTGEYDPTIGEVTMILDVTEYMADKIGIPNRMSAEELITSYLQMLEMTPQGFAFIMLDVDNFKGINDTYNHETGDEVLSSIARMLKGSIRSTDIVGRYGGDEMFILLKNISAEDALTIAEKLRTNAEELKIFYLGQQIPPPTISLGLYFVPETELEDLKDLCGEKGSYSKVIGAIEKAADSALMGSKRFGKNRVVTVNDFSEKSTFVILPRKLIKKPEAYHERRMTDV